MRSVFILIPALITCSAIYAQDVSGSNYPAATGSSRIQTNHNGSPAGFSTAINTSSITGTNIVMSLPPKWASRQVKVEIFNEKGKLIRCITERKASPFIIISLEGIPLGAYELRTSCGKETNSQLTIVAGQS
jgi:hypothetical protein